MTDTPTPSKCELCGEPMPEGETMFKVHGYSGPCPKPPKAPSHEIKQGYPRVTDAELDDVINSGDCSIRLVIALDLRDARALLEAKAESKEMQKDADDVFGGKKL